MGLVEISGLLLVLLIALLAGGVWIAIALMACGWVGMQFVGGGIPAGSVLATTIWGNAASWTLAALPLFVWMGEILSLTLGLAFVGFFAWHAVRLTYDSWRFNNVAQGVLAVPLWIPQLGYSTGLVILFVAFVDEFVHVIRGGDPRYEKPPPASAEEVVERAIQSGV